MRGDAASSSGSARRSPHDVQRSSTREPADVVARRLHALRSTGRGARRRACRRSLVPARSGFPGRPLVEMLAPGLTSSTRSGATSGSRPSGRSPVVHDASALASCGRRASSSRTCRCRNVVSSPRCSTARPSPEQSTPRGRRRATTARARQLQHERPGPGRRPATVRSRRSAATGPGVVTTGPAIDPEDSRPAPNTEWCVSCRTPSCCGTVSLVITHAGLGTTLMAALGHGVPMVCVPMGHDQFFNADQFGADRRRADAHARCRARGDSGCVRAGAQPLRVRRCGQAHGRGHRCLSRRSGRGGCAGAPVAVKSRERRSRGATVKAGASTPSTSNGISPDHAVRTSGILRRRPGAQRTAVYEVAETNWRGLHRRRR